MRDNSILRCWRALLGVLAGFFGVRSEAAREQDFKEGRALHFVVIGLLMAAGFVIFVIFLVRWALSLSGV
ncbi:hypothetical protein ADIMK_2932 [Marinobacterium lacunae]|uniref:DUF2970 domain-containing protein n=1 Tax=Marinobacterium lacunae TaxID=1232683 RepID=A0A081FWQ7_9GAMM|nr:DUF2970 domain-containing protein [Marinobacterium lacunae]KEA62962.1 hypothetical protein ADIMK_2932 [Marinobacterium lacunae]MBR9883751.1 DUF2970 domain-containing protein [Oceanospirillales bacterium]